VGLLAGASSLPWRRCWRRQPLATSSRHAFAMDYSEPPALDLISRTIPKDDPAGARPEPSLDEQSAVQHHT
jgi:hypothetical protein